MEIKKRENIGWVDLLRVIACFLVVFCHCCDPFVGQADADRGAFLAGVFSGSSVRACVPLFVMMSGVLLFPVRMGMGEFYKKRLGRLVAPLVFWSVALPLLYYVYLNFVATTDNPAIAMENFTFNATLTKIYTFVFNFNYDTTPLWYLYMLVGLYFVMPIFGVWLDGASRKDVKLFLYLWGVSLVLPYVKMVAPLCGYTGNWGSMDILGGCFWNEYGSFYYVSGFIGYLVLAHYLVKYPLDWSWSKLLSLTIPMFVAGYLITSLGFLATQEVFPGNYEYLEIVWYFAGINVFMMTFPVFAIVQKMKVPSRPWVSHLASMSFGIYLCHFVFVQVVYDLLSALGLPPFVYIVCMAVTAFFISYVVVWAMSRWGLTRRFVM